MKRFIMPFGWLDDATKEGKELLAKLTPAKPAEPVKTETKATPAAAETAAPPAAAKEKK